MTRTEFVSLLEDDLHFRRIPFTRADLQEFVDSCWPLMLDNPDVCWWASEFINHASNPTLLNASENLSRTVQRPRRPNATALSPQ